MLKIVALIFSALLVASCSTAQKSMKMTANASFGCSGTNYKGTMYEGPTDDGCGYKLIGRVGTGVLEPIDNTQEKGEPIDSSGRPTNLLELEAGYVRHGDMKFDGLWGGVPDSGKIEADGYIVGVVYTRRVDSRLDLFANVGAHWWDVEENEVYDGIPLRSEASGTSPYYGVGGRYWFHPKAAVRASIERYADVGEDGVTGEGNIDSVWLGVDYSF